jgi:hypothetical protein
VTAGSRMQRRPRASQPVDCPPQPPHHAVRTRPWLSRQRRR